LNDSARGDFTQRWLCRELILFNRAHLFEAILPIDSELLARQLTRMFLQFDSLPAYKRL
jgi:hypothetical protein